MQVKKLINHFVKIRIYVLRLNIYVTYYNKNEDEDNSLIEKVRQA